MLFLFYLIKKLIMETELEKNERLYRCEVDTLNKLLEKKYELERLIRHQEENVIHRADLFLKSKQK
jgi:hypothetical protein